MREVAAQANPDAPAATSQRAFDAARERSTNHADLPAARRITEQLRLSWREVLAVAHAPEDRQAQLVGVKTRAPSSADWLTPEHVTAALRLVAARLGCRGRPGQLRQDSLTTSAYRVERAQLLAADHARWLHGRWLLLPDDEQVIAVAGSWDAALRAAGLATDTPRPRSAHQVVLTRAAAIERFHEHYGKRPSRRELEAFVRGNGIPMKAERERKWSEIVAEWERLRHERGLPPARVDPRSPGRPSPKRPRTSTSHYGRNVSAARPGEHPIRGKWTRASCAAAVARYLAQLRPGERSTERGYADWTATQPRDTTPALATVQENGGWEAVRREAQEHKFSAEGIRPNSTNLRGMSIPEKQDPIEAAQRIKEILDSGNFLNEELPGLLHSLEGELSRASASVAANHHEQHDSYNDLAETTRQLRSALDKHVDKNAAPAIADKDNDGTEKVLKELTKTFGQFLDDVILGSGKQ